MEASKVITLRNVCPELAQRLKTLAESTGTSVNSTILRILDQSLGIDQRRRHLAERYGTWTEDDLLEFEQALRAQRQIDHDIWR